MRSNDRITVMGMLSMEPLTMENQAGKELFGLGPHEKQYAHPHWSSTIGAFSVGYSHLVPRLPIAVGADITLYHIPTDLESYYDPSHSFHVFLHWRPRTAHAPTHVH